MVTIIRIMVNINSHVLAYIFQMNHISGFLLLLLLLGFFLMLLLLLFLFCFVFFFFVLFFCFLFFVCLFVFFILKKMGVSSLKSLQTKV